VTLAGGHIEYAGRELQTLDPKARRALRGGILAMVFQEPMTSLNPVLSIGLPDRRGGALASSLHGRALRTRCVELLDAVGIGAARRPFSVITRTSFSGGMKQRVMIADGARR